MLDVIEQLHQQVRDYVEKAYPNYFVTAIRGETETTYEETLASRKKRGFASAPSYTEDDDMSSINPYAFPVHILESTRLSFLVDAVHLYDHSDIRCLVVATAQGFDIERVSIGVSNRPR